MNCPYCTKQGIYHFNNETVCVDHYYIGKCNQDTELAIQGYEDFSEIYNKMSKIYLSINL